MTYQKSLLTLKEASRWASNYLNRDISESNISYLIQYGKVRKHNGNGITQVNLVDLKEYYQSFYGKREISWKKHLGDDLNWSLSFDHLREKDTTKHVHRLHPYKGKFIPQLVQYFIDDHTDEFKKEAYFKPGDIILDPFSGSGTTLVQAKEMGIHSIGIDISKFNCMISQVKLNKYNFESLHNEIIRIKKALAQYQFDSGLSGFEYDLIDSLKQFNDKYFPSPQFKYNVLHSKIDENKYALAKEQDFLAIFKKLVSHHNVQLTQQKSKRFLDKWYSRNARAEIDFVFNLIKQVKNDNNKKILAVILSRTIRSCRATTHSDLATLKEPTLVTYYCFKHKKICKPLFSIKYWLNRYANDTFRRIREYNNLSTSALFAAIPADSRIVNLFAEVKKRNTRLFSLLKEQKIQGIFTSPPYVGQINYHEQHAYAYDLFGFERRDELEIGPLYKGKGDNARNSYIQGVSDVLINCKKYLNRNFDIFLVANDKYDIYPKIASVSGLQIVNKFKRPVLNRTERDKSPYSEIIFHMKSNR